MKSIIESNLISQASLTLHGMMGNKQCYWFVIIYLPGNNAQIVWSTFIVLFVLFWSLNVSNYFHFMKKSSSDILLKVWFKIPRIKESIAGLYYIKHLRLVRFKKIYLKFFFWMLIKDAFMWSKNFKTVILWKYNYI